MLALGGFALDVMNLNPVCKLLVSTGLALTFFWMTSSLAASHWVYDRSIICKWTWITDCLPETPRCWVNIHAGLDESSPELKKMLPGTSGEVLDIFDPQEMTEASIAEARRRPGNELPVRRADFRALPLGTGDLDAIFLLFAAHEIRHFEVRLQFFGELRRVLNTSGRILICEHLRDWRNFLAYGPGCFHFQSRGAWLRAAAQTGLEVEKEFSITPFVRIFILKKLP